MTLSVLAEVNITLQSGQQMRGEIVFQNDDVVVFKNSDGQRFQYPMTEVESIKEIDDSIIEVAETTKVTKPHKVGIVVEFSGGAAFVPQRAIGGNFEANIFIGANNLLDSHIFLGTGIGYSGNFMSLREVNKTLISSEAEEDENGNIINEGTQGWEENVTKTPATYSFIPIQLRVAVPLMQTKHAPAIGASIGYGFCTEGISKSGLAASLDLGYRMQINPTSAFFAGVELGLQQTKMEVIQSFENEYKQDNFKSNQTRNLCRINLKVAIQF